MRRWGPASIFVVRFMVGMRTALFFAAGSLRIPYRHLLMFDGVAALLELPLLVYGVRAVGGRWQHNTYVSSCRPATLRENARQWAWRQPP